MAVGMSCLPDASCSVKRSGRKASNKGQDAKPIAMKTREKILRNAGCLPKSLVLAVFTPQREYVDGFVCFLFLETHMTQSMRAEMQPFL